MDLEENLPFANYVSYEGSDNQIYKFIEGLKQAGFVEFSDDVEDIKAVLTYRDGTYHRACHTGCDNPLRFTSDQFAEALAAATKPAE